MTPEEIKALVYPFVWRHVLFLLSAIHFFLLSKGTPPKGGKSTVKRVNTFPEYRPPLSYTSYFPDSIGHQPRQTILAFYPQLRTRHWIPGFLTRLLLMGSKIIVVHFCVELAKIILTIPNTRARASEIQSVVNHRSTAIHNTLKKKKKTKDKNKKATLISGH